MEITRLDQLKGTKEVEVNLNFKITFQWEEMKKKGIYKKSGTSLYVKLQTIRV